MSHVTGDVAERLADGFTQSKVFAMQTSHKSSSTIVQELRDFLHATENADFKKDFEASFVAALHSGVREFEDYSIRTLADYLDWYEYLLGWVPSEQQDGQFVYHVICLFYFVMNLDPLQARCSPVLPATRAPYTWLSQWVIRYAKEVGKFMDTPESITPYTMATFCHAPSYRMEDYPVPEGGWKTFNEFFARHIDPAKRPIDSPNTDSIIVSPADAVFDGAWEVNDSCECHFAVKGVPWPICELLDDEHSGTSYAETFARGQFCHAFLGPNDYHRQHAPVSGKVLEARVIEGLCYLHVTTKQDASGRMTIAPHRRLFRLRHKVHHRGEHHNTEHAHRTKAEHAPVVVTMEAPDEPGYQFIQARALILIETKDMGLVAVLPIGMAHISSVLLSVKAGDVVKKGDELAYFHFGGSDVVMVFQEQAGIQFTAEVGTHYNVGQKIAVSHNGLKQGA
ncbi:hypothetical protein L226DRAFT_520594 [Lentinus tigrinus ALCF2SS1-7]|uniref:uncharacterized protein n=1 Tax=Lentinus tigrinus ALCF2SS1-7 TaxID=1328758 RepID=UPI001165DEAB|nr:hypothetical protein L226DRAFT_520594 [Lentinus tigrinus ALCF2SS1-7]